MAIPFSRSRQYAIRPSPIFLGIVGLAVAGGVLAWFSEYGSVGAKAGAFIVVFAGWVVTLCLHEFGHAFTAWKFGDTDAHSRGYLTLNPLKYTDPLLSLGLPVIFIALGGIALPGGAVWLNKSGMSRKQRSLVSLAGPAVNVICAFVLLVVISVFGSSNKHGSLWFALSFLALLQIIAVFLNMLPVPGLDGYGAIEPYLSPERQRSLAQIAPFGFLIVFGLLMLPDVNRVFFDAVYQVFGWSGVSDLWAYFGRQLAIFWSGQL